MIFAAAPVRRPVGWRGRIRLGSRCSALVIVLDTRPRGRASRAHVTGAGQCAGAMAAPTQGRGPLMPMMTGARFLAETLTCVRDHALLLGRSVCRSACRARPCPNLDAAWASGRLWPTPKRAQPTWPTASPRISGGAGVCGAQSVGALNLAAGLQDAFLACSPVLALTGRLPQIMQNRHAYQEVDHSAPFAAVHQVRHAGDIDRRVPDLPAPGIARSSFRAPRARRTSTSGASPAATS